MQDKTNELYACWFFNTIFLKLNEKGSWTIRSDLMKVYERATKPLFKLTCLVTTIKIKISITLLLDIG